MSVVERFIRLYQGLSHPPDVRPMALSDDWPAVQQLLAEEEWPFVRGDLEIGEAQPGSAAFVAHEDGAFAGFFTCHTFGTVGYLDMLIVAAAHRRGPVAQALYLAGTQALESFGATGLVVHSTQDSARIIRLLGFSAGQSFTLLTRDADHAQPLVPVPACADELWLDADAKTFGMRRTAWTQAMRTAGVQLVGDAFASCALRPRTDDALCLDSVSATTDEALETLIDRVVAGFGDHALQCFAKTDGALHRRLLARGFTVPEFFVPIGPLTEWRRGDTAGLGEGDVHSLMWL